MKRKKFSIGYFNVSKVEDEESLYTYCTLVSLGKLAYKDAMRKELLAELHQSIIAGKRPIYEDTSPFLQALYSNGFIAYMEGLAGFQKLSWVRRVYVPSDIPLEEQYNIKTRIVTAGYEGLLFGLDSYNPKLKEHLHPDKRLLSFFSHLAYWVKTYAKIEATIICGERSGILILSEMDKNKRSSPIEQKRRKIINITKKLPQSISYDHVLKYLHDKGYIEINMADVQYALGGLSIPTKNVDNEMPSNINRYSGKFISYNLLDHIYTIEKVRKELLYALANNIGGGRKIAFTAERARAVDIYYFGMLPLVDDIYEDSGEIFRYKSLVGQLKKLKSINNSTYSLVIKDKIAIIEKKLNDIRDSLLIKIPDVDTKLFSIGMVNYPFKLLDDAGDNAINKIAHLKIKNNKLDLAALNLATRRLSAFLKCGANYLYVSEKRFNEAKRDISFIVRLVEERGYFDPSSYNVLPSVQETYKLNAGYVPTRVFDWNNKPLFVKVFGEYKPMLTWVK